MTFWTIFLIFVLYHNACQATVCTARGRFPNNLDPNCRGYTMCLSGAVGFTNYDLSCPENSIYSHLENQCTNVTTYQCLSNYNCTLEGKFENPSSENCTSYIACVKDLNDIITARLVFCPVNEVFSASESMCVNETLSKCDQPTESPKVIQVLIDDIPIISGNFSINNAVCLNAMYLYLISLAFIIL